MRRSERLILTSRILSENPNRIISLNVFSDKFNAAKSSISEDIDIIKNAYNMVGDGELATIPGAAGGVRYRVKKVKEEIIEFLGELADILEDENRIIPGGYVYMTDIIFSPEYSAKIGEIFSQLFIERNPTCVLTVETKGIPIALMTAKALNIPLIVARRDSRVTEGPSVSISYVSGSGQNIHNMSLPKRALEEKARVLLVDDFMKGGGTARGMSDLVSEFKAEVVGTAMVVSTAIPKEKLVKDSTPLLILGGVDPQRGKISIKLNDDLLKMF